MAIFTCLQKSALGDLNTEDDHALYSSTIHTAIFTIMGVLIGLLQINPTGAEVSKDILRAFLVLTLIYFVLLVCEVKLKKRRGQALFHHFIGHFSHLFGFLAADMLLSLIFPIFALVVAVLCLFLFFFEMYNSFAKLKVQQDLESGNANPSNQHSTPSSAFPIELIPRGGETSTNSRGLAHRAKLDDNLELTEMPEAASVGTVESGKMIKDVIRGSNDLDINPTEATVDIPEVKDSPRTRSKTRRLREGFNGAVETLPNTMNFKDLANVPQQSDAYSNSTNAPEIALMEDSARLSVQEDQTRPTECKPTYLADTKAQKQFTFNLEAENGQVEPEDLPSTKELRTREEVQPNIHQEPGGRDFTHKEGKRVQELTKTTSNQPRIITSQKQIFSILTICAGQGEDPSG